jgi:hypothetical protein
MRNRPCLTGTGVCRHGYVINSKFKVEIGFMTQIQETTSRGQFQIMLFNNTPFKTINNKNLRTICYLRFLFKKSYFACFQTVISTDNFYFTFIRHLLKDRAVRFNCFNRIFYIVL